MSPRSVGASLAAESHVAAEGPVAATLTWLQHIGETPVVNPTRKRWTAPDEPMSLWRAAGWFAYATVILLALVGYAIWFGGGSSAFIYAGF